LDDQPPANDIFLRKYALARQWYFSPETNHHQSLTFSQPSSVKACTIPLLRFEKEVHIYIQMSIHTRNLSYQFDCMSI
jgi:hypothetical protein